MLADKIMLKTSHTIMIYASARIFTPKACEVLFYAFSNSLFDFVSFLESYSSITLNH